MKNKKKIIFILTGLLILITAIGISYAYFYARIFGSESISTISGTAAYLEITFEDQNDTINGVDIIPGWTATKSFTVTNTGEGLAYYVIKVKDIINEFTLPGSISLSISGTNGGQSVSRMVLPSTNKDLTSAIAIDVGVTHNYTVTAYYNDLDADQIVDLGNSFSFTITIDKSA